MTRPLKLLTLLFTLLAPLGALATPPCTTARRCKAACKRGDAAACNELGARHYAGEGAKRSDRKARRLYYRACELGDVVGCVNIAWMQLDGEGGRVEIASAADLFQRACDAGDADSCAGLGLALAEQSGAGPGRARPHLKTACAANNARACAKYGMLLVDGDGGPVDKAAGTQALAAACKGGEVAACAAQARAAIDGAPDEAFKLGKAACDAGNGEGCLVLGTLHRGATGKGGAQAALQAFDTGCGAGNAEACREAGRLLREGAIGVSPRPKTARKRLLRARDLGDAEACLDLAKMYREGQGGRRSEWRALLHFGLACEAGVAAACGRRLNIARHPEHGLAYNKASLQAGRARQRCSRRNLSACVEAGDLFFTGTGTRHDPEEAEGLYERACERGSTAGCTRLVWLRN